MAAGALANLKVVEYGELVSAPFCGRLLADAGAEVIKVERSGTGDPSRRRGPFPNDIPHPERSGLYLALNNNKLGITLDIEQPTGRRILRDLLHDADLFVENTPGGFMERLGLDYASVRDEFPRLIYASLSPYGRTGPYRDYKAYDANTAALGGIADQMGHPPREPMAPPYDQGGHQAGLHAASAALVAVLARQTTGRGQHIDIAEADIWAAYQTGIDYMTYEGGDPTPSVRARTRAAAQADGYPPPCWRTKDGIMLGGTPQAAQFQRFLVMIGKPEWVQDPRFQSRRNLPPDAARELLDAANAWFASRTTNEALQAIFEHRLTFTPALTIGELVNSPQEAARGFFGQIDRDEVGVLRYPLASFVLSKTPVELRRPAPLLGQHNEEILCGRLGYSREDLAMLYRSGVI